jgi:hypothetical protein
LQLSNQVSTAQLQLPVAWPFYAPYSHETDFAQTSKPLDPDACDWLIIAREKVLLPE